LSSIASGVTKTGSIAMRQIPLLGSFAAALMLTGASSAFAQSDIYRDLRDVRLDRADIYRDQASLREERAERNYDARREWRAIQQGNWRAARYWDAHRRHEQHDVNVIKRDLRDDRGDLARDKADLHHDIWRYTH
jgi:hypothetical protein